jgi:hypothetical protein
LVKYKTCKRCGEKKLSKEFYRLRSAKYKDSWDCRDSYCKSCRSEYTKERAHYFKRQAVEYLGGKCSRCGLETTHYEIYDFHHTDPSKKDMSISDNRMSFDTLKPELDKCRLYCSNCHRIIHYGVKPLIIKFGCL